MNAVPGLYSGVGAVRVARPTPLFASPEAGTYPRSPLKWAPAYPALAAAPAVVSDAPAAASGTTTGLGGLLRQTLVATVVLVGLVGLAGWLLQDPINALTAWSMEALGLPGVFLGVFFADTFTLPVTPDTYLFASVAANAAALPMLAIVSAASVLAGTAAYRLGPYVARLPVVRRKIEANRERGEAFFGRYGMWAVALAAVTPLPYSVFAYLAGIYRMSYRRFVLACLLRVPRFVAYVLLFRVVWTG